MLSNVKIGSVPSNNFTRVQKRTNKHTHKQTNTQTNKQTYRLGRINCLKISYSKKAQDYTSWEFSVSPLLEIIVIEFLHADPIVFISC